jgi:hypothetical protein
MLDKYCSIFVKYFECGKLACLVTKISTVHFNKQLNKFVRVCYASLPVYTLPPSQDI